MQAHQLKQVDEEKKRYEIAYLNVVAQSTDKKGKPKFETFKDFYDYEERLASVSNGEYYKKSKLSEEKKKMLTLVAKRRKDFRERRGTS